MSSRHTAELMEHLAYVRRQLALRRGCVSAEPPPPPHPPLPHPPPRSAYKDALALPFHLDAATYLDATYLDATYLDATYLDASGQAFTGRLAYLPFRGRGGGACGGGACDYAFEPAFIRKRNERERYRVRCVNDGYARLREHLPRELEEKRLSKVETLRAAIDYIHHLQALLERTGDVDLDVDVDVRKRRV